MPLPAKDLWISIVAFMGIFPYHTMEMDSELTQNLRETILSHGADLVGFADITILPEGLREGLPGAISIAKGYEAEIIQSIRNGPNIRYAKAYCELNAELNAIAQSMAGYIKGLGFNAFPLSATVRHPSNKVPNVDFESLEDMTTSLPHKTIATLSGLGWIGKTDLLINEKYGPRIRLITILTDAPFVYDTPITASRCGECLECVIACPVDAGRKENWFQGSPERYDVVRCDEYTRTISGELGLDGQLCGICIAACPVGL